MQKTPEQQIDEAVESLKTLLVPQARNKQEADEIKRRLDSLGHEAKAVSAIVNAFIQCLANVTIQLNAPLHIHRSK